MSGATIIVAVLVLLGWVLNDHRLTKMAISETQVRPLAAFCFILLSLSAIMRRREAAAGMPRIGSGIMALVVLTLGAATLLEHVLQVNLGIDSLLFGEHMSREEFPGFARIPLLTALCLSLDAAALLWPWGREEVRQNVRQGLAFLATAVALTVLLAYSYGVAEYLRIGHLPQIPAGGALLAALASLGVLLASTRAGFMAFLTGAGGGSAMLRRNLPLAFCGPVLAGWAALWGIRDLGLPPGPVVAVLIVAGTLFFLGMFWTSAALLNAREEESRAAEARLKRSEKRFGLLAEFAPIGIFERDLTGRIVYANKRFFEMTGLPPEVAGVAELLALVPQDKAGKDFAAGLSGGGEPGRPGQPFMLLRPDGATLWLLASSSPQAGPDGQVYGHIHTLTDLTRLEAVEAALRESEARYTEFFQTNSVVQLVIDPVNGDILDANKAAEFFYGYSIGELRSMNIDAINSLNRPDVLGRMADAVRRDKSIFNFTHRLASGELRQVESHATPISIHGRKALHSIVIDITDRLAAEREVSRAKEDWERTFNAIPDYIAVLDRHHNVVRCNAAMAQAVGLSVEEIVGRKCYRLMHGQECPPEDCPYCENDPDAGVRTAEIHIDSLDRDFLVMVIHFSDSAGLPGGCVHIARDITDKKKTESAVAEARNRLEYLISSSPIGIYTCSPQGACPTTFISPNVASLVGYPPEAFLGDALFWEKIVHPEDLEILRKAMRDLLASDEEPALCGRRVVAEYRFRHADGSWRWARDEMLLLRDAWGHPREIVGSVLDITGRKKAEEELRLSEERFSLFMSHSPVVSFIKDEQGRYVFYNNAISAYYDFQDDSWWGKTDDDLYTGDVAATLKAHDAKVMESWLPQAFEEMTARNGRTHWWLTHKFPFRDAAGDVYIGGTSVDMTERKRIDEELTRARVQADAANRAKSEFLANMSHEVRTPLAGVIGLLQMLMTSQLEDKDRSTVAMALSAADSLVSIINDILDFSRIEAGKLEMHPLPFAFRPVLDNVLSQLRLEAGRKGLDFRLSIGHGVPEAVVGDSERLGQILRNLVSNALKFTPSGRIEVEVSDVPGEAWMADETVLRFEVRDTGVGIAPDVLPRLFQSFSQGDSSISKRYGGTGLGLAISRNLVEMMGGEIGVESREGEGSRFWFTVRFGLSQDGVPAESRTFEPNGAANAEPPHGLRILLVDDSSINQKFMRHFITQAGNQADLAANGSEALHLLLAKDYDLVVMDIQMPVMDGIEALRHIRAGDGGVDPTLPVIALTAYAMRHDRERIMAAGFDDYVTKPVDMDILMASIRRLVAARQV